MATSRKSDEKTGTKTAAKTMTSPLSGSTIPTGAHPKNTGGKKGRSGRKPDWLKKWCDNLLANPKCKKQVKEILEDKAHPAFKSMWAAVADRAHGKPAQSIDVTSNGQTLEQLVVASWDR